MNFVLHKNSELIQRGWSCLNKGSHHVPHMLCGLDHKDTDRPVLFFVLCEAESNEPWAAIDVLLLLIDFTLPGICVSWQEAPQKLEPWGPSNVLCVTSSVRIRAMALRRHFKTRSCSYFKFNLLFLTHLLSSQDFWKNATYYETLSPLNHGQ